MAECNNNNAVLGGHKSQSKARSADGTVNLESPAIDAGALSQNGWCVFCVVVVQKTDGPTMLSHERTRGRERTRVRAVEGVESNQSYYGARPSALAEDQNPDWG
jgi:hypothetical protein